MLAFRRLECRGSLRLRVLSGEADHAIIAKAVTGKKGLGPSVSLALRSEELQQIISDPREFLQLGEHFTKMRVPRQMAQNLHIQDHPKVRSALPGQQLRAVAMVAYNLDAETQWAAYEEAQRQQGAKKRVWENMRRRLGRGGVGMAMRAPLTQDKVIVHALTQHILSLPQCYLSYERNTAVVTPLEQRFAPPACAPGPHISKNGVGTWGTTFVSPYPWPPPFVSCPSCLLPIVEMPRFV